MQEQLPLWRRVTRAILVTLLTAVLFLAFYLAVIMGNPRREDAGESTVRQHQPLVSALAAPVCIHDQSQLNALRDAFPAPLMTGMNMSVMTLVDGICQDVRFEGGLARKATLTYRTADGSTILVESIYPARALALIPKGDYAISNTPGLHLAGIRSVRMDSATSSRMHAQGDEALYVVTMPILDAQALRTITATLQLQ